MNQAIANQATHYALVVKKDCPTCALIEPVIHSLANNETLSLKVYVQDDPSFPADIEDVIDDSSLEYSYQQEIEVVPTLIRLSDGNDAQSEESRIYGWDQKQWQNFTGIQELGAELIDFKPGCGSKTQDPGMDEVLALRFGKQILQARAVELAEAEDIMEACFERGWSDGLPVVPPTPLRVMRMLNGSDRDAAEIIGKVPPDNVPCSIEKIAINAVMAGCKPEYFPMVIASVEAALQDRFCMHGLLCTTYFSSPVMVVSGPVAKQIGMNSGINALGQGNRANATIGRALQLIIRNVGGGVPGGIDRANMGNPGKYTYCFAEDESDENWASLAMDRGFDRADSVISLFAGDGLQPILDQQSRTPQSLAKSMAMSLRSVAHTKLFGMADAILVVCPEHRRVFREGGWDKEDLRKALYEELMSPGTDIVRGANDIAEGMPEKFKDKILNKFRDDGLHIVTTGGTAGMFSAIIGGWVASGERGSQLVSTKL
ncbi:thioredoxin [Gammaproteobacteria bacterium]|nr:thioredoxin [Pseudomonadales bacterium]MDB3909671.1 thioredoxin [Gammaproteobacteria bacterium]MDC3196303.1 thioredoxin [Gammaproteobacteria bacterium]HAS48159.1 thioredoxin [Gammaproteobacteria bacterium]